MEQVIEQEAPNTADEQSTVEEAEAVETVETPNDAEQETSVNEATQQEKIDHAFAKKQRELQEQRQEAERLRKERDDLRLKIEESQKPQRPEIPPMPDVYDDDYEAKQALREAAIIEQAKYDAQQQLVQQQQEQLQLQQQQQRQQEILQKEQDYLKRGKDMGMSDTEITQIGNNLSPFVGPEHAETVEFILGHEQGPLIAKYLANNPTELDKVTKSTPVMAVANIVTNIVPKVQKLVPKPTGTPEPVETLDGKSPPQQESPWLAGAKFE